VETLLSNTASNYLLITAVEFIKPRHSNGVATVTDGPSNYFDDSTDMGSDNERSQNIKILLISNDKNKTYE